MNVWRQCIVYLATYSFCSWSLLFSSEQLPAPPSSEEYVRGFSDGHEKGFSDGRLFGYKEAVSIGNITGSHIGGNVNQTFNYTSVIQGSGLDPEQEIKNFIEELLAQQDAIHENKNRLSTSSTATLMLGETGVGKSTFLAWLLATEESPLYAKENKYGSIVLEKPLNTDLVIGHATQSGTLCATPLLVPCNPEEQLFWDCPGLKDVKGAYYDIKHMAGLHNVLSVTPNVNLIVVVDEAKIESTRTSDLLLFFNQIASMFFISPESIAASYLLITKTTPFKSAVKLQDYVDDLNNILDTNTRSWLRFIVEHNKILSMSKPNKEGKYRVSPESIRTLLNNGVPTQIRFQPILSIDSLLYLNKLAVYVNTQIERIFDSNKDTFTHNFVSYIKNLEQGDQEYERCVRMFIERLQTTLHAPNVLSTKQEVMETYGESLLNLFLKTSQGQQEQHKVSASIDILHTLRTLLGSNVKTIAGLNVSIYFALQQWVNPLERLKQYVDEVNNCLEKPEEIQKENLSICRQREWKHFKSLPQIPWANKRLSFYRDEFIGPDFARDHEAVYERFVNGKLVFDSREKGILWNSGQYKEFPFAQFKDTLEGEFDLKGLTYTYVGETYKVSDYLSINLGYRKAQNPEHRNKVEVWILPKFLMERDIAGEAAHYKPIMNKWTSDVGILWTWGNWPSHLGDCDHLTNQQFDLINNKNIAALAMTSHHERMPTFSSAGKVPRYSPPFNPISRLFKILF